VSSIEILVLQICPVPGSASAREGTQGLVLFRANLRSVLFRANLTILHICPVPGSTSARNGERGSGKEGEGEGGRVSEGQGGEEGGKERGREWQTVAYLPPLPYSPEGGVLTEKKNKRLWTRGSGHGGCEEGEGRKGEGCFVVPPAGTSLFFLVSFSRTFLIFC
jgi:hypothetical protein